jgi:hypothetical protein
MKGLAAVVSGCLLVSLLGCGGAAGPAVDSGPFEAAVVKYLDEHNMALAIKEVKAGPVVDGETATMTASLTHAELGGAAVTWDFEFEKAGEGGWKAVRHED